MAMSIAILSDLIKAEIESSMTVDDETELQKLTDAIADGVVSHIQGAATVTGTTATGTPGGPLPIALPAGSIL